MKQKMLGWSARCELQCGELAVLTVSAASLTEACEKLRLIHDDIDLLHVRETTMIERRDEPREMESYRAVEVDWGGE